ncbi:MAG: HEAT repeat domain-containing protein [Candidatus Celaenobacter antarcticus]|nr:HEAT repeat domain-containing protein [Candidatus Celaenobacter antarcticus]
MKEFSGHAMRKKYLNLIIILVIILLNHSSLFAKKKSDKEIQTYPYEWSFQQDTEPLQTEVVGNPLDYAGRRIGIDVRNFELPRAYENSYRFACRFPLIDYVSNQPLYMKQWTEDVSERFIEIQKKEGIKVTNYALELLRDTQEFPSMSISENVELLEDFKDMIRSRSFSTSYQNAVSKLVEKYLIAKSLVSKAKENLSPDDLKFFNDNPAYFLIPDGEHMPSLTGDVSTQFEFIEHARKFKYQYMFFAAKIMSEAIYNYWNLTKDMSVSDIYNDQSAYKEPFIYVTNSLRIVIRGVGDDVYTKDADLLIDIGGDDIYQNNAGGCRSSFEEIAVCIDHNGNDTYDSPNDTYVQGFGFLGCGFLADFNGNDIYSAKHFAQGAGVCGVGVLWDESGFDTYDAHAFCQGAGMFGLGMLLDNNGEDIYDCATLGQGGATTLGMGVLSDLDGDDRYYLAIDESKDKLGNLAGYGQGGALSFRNYPWSKKLTAYGGAGLLFDASGNDRYWAKGWCDQGGSYIMSLGALVDQSGNDHYTANTGQGSGIHITNAILIDKEGHDIYEGGFRTGGSGGDRSPGFFIDYAGNDVYRSGTSSYGTGVKPASYSLFIDYQGADTYICDEPENEITFNNWQSFGGVWPGSEPYSCPYAICMDLEGEDDYHVRYHKNNCERSSFGHGIFIDTEWNEGDVIGEITNELKKQKLPELSDKIKESTYYRDITELLSSSAFIRFQAIGKIIRNSADIIPYLTETLKTSENRNVNRDVLEIIHYYIMNNMLDENTEKELISCLDSPDEEVRYVIADDIGMWNIETGENALLNIAVSDTSADVRYAVLRSLVQLESMKGLLIARRLSEKDPSEKVRRIATDYQGVVDDGVDPFPLLSYILQHDSSPSVRVEAAEAFGKLKDDRAVPLLRKASQSFDVYLQRAAGKSLAELGYIEGIDILIKSLSFPSIDAFENYNYNVPNFISMYSGFDLPESERYDQQKWREWFDKNKFQIDIQENLKNLDVYHVLQDSIDQFEQQEKIPFLEKFVASHSNFIKAKKDLAQILNRAAWDMVTAPETSEKYNPKSGVEYAKRAVELDPQLNYIDTLAEAYYQNGDYANALKICNDIIGDNPKDKMFLERKELCEKKLQN